MAAAATFSLALTGAATAEARTPAQQHPPAGHAGDAAVTLPESKAAAEDVAPQGQVLGLLARCTGIGNSFLYYKITTREHTVAAGDVLEYDLYLDPASPEASGGIDIQFTSGASLRDSGATDTDGRSAHPNTVIDDASGRWLHRRIPLDRLEGETTQRWNLVAEGDRAGVYTLYVDNLNITRNGQVVAGIYQDETPAGELDWSSGYDDSRTAFFVTAARPAYRRGFPPLAAGEPAAGWELLQLDDLRNARAASPHEQTSSVDDIERLYPQEELPAGDGLLHGIPFSFSTDAARDHVRTAGQAIQPRLAGGRYYELHLAVANVTGENLEASWELLGAKGESLSVRTTVPSRQASAGSDLFFFSHAHQGPVHEGHGEGDDGAPGPEPPAADVAAPALGVISLPLAAPFPVVALRLPAEPRVLLFAATWQRRDDALEDAAFRRPWLLRSVPFWPVDRYLRNLEYGPLFTDLEGEEEHEKRLFQLYLEGDESEFSQLLGERLDQFAARSLSVKSDVLHFVGESHIDMEWLWPWRETVNVCRDTFSQALAFMDEFPQFRFTQGSSQAYRWMESYHPELFDAIAQRVQGGQWEIVGGTWTEADFNLPAGESLARQFLAGQSYLEDRFGAPASVGWAPDSFGYSRQLPQLLRGAGLDSFFTTKMLWNDTTPFPYHLFSWQAPDGSTVLASTPPQGIGSRVVPERLPALLDAMEERHGIREVMIPFGVGDHGGGPSREDIETILALKDTDLAPTVRMGTAREYLDSVLERKDLRLPTLDDEMYLQYHRGTYTSQGRIKWFNRKGEIALLTGERFGALAMADGIDFPREAFGDLWHRLLFHQCHDGLPGTSIREVVTDIHADFATLLPAGEAFLDASLAALARSIDTRGPGRALVVFNPLAWERAAPVEIPWGEVAVVDSASAPVASQKTAVGTRVFMATVPSLGYAVYHLVPPVPSAGGPGADAAAGTENGAGLSGDAASLAAPSSDIEVNGWTLANAHLQARFDPGTGHLSSLVARRGNTEALAGDGNLLELYRDRPSQWDAWNLGLSDRQVLDQVDSMEIVEQGPVRAVLRLARSFSASRIVQDVVLWSGRPWLEFHTHVDWQEDHKLLRAAFPLRQVNDTAIYHVPFGTTSRPARPSSDTERAMFEVPALYWGARGDGAAGVALLNDSKYGYSAADNWLRLSLLKAATWPDPHQDRGKHDFVYAVGPYDGDWRAGGVMHSGYDLNFPLRFVEAPAHPGPRDPVHAFLRLSMRTSDGRSASGALSGVLLTALKPAADGDGWILRLNEFFGRSGVALLTFDRPVASASRVDLLENASGGLGFQGRTIALPIDPHRIETIQVRLRPQPR